METSAKSGLNAQKLFVTAAKTLYDDVLKYKVKEIEVKDQRKVLNSISKTIELNNLGEDEATNSNEGCC